MFFLYAPIFGDKHTIGLITIALLFVFFANLLNHKKDLNVYKVIGVFLILFYLLEAFKIGYIIYQDKAYPLNHLPFHLCSLPLYLYPLIYVLRNNNFVQKFVMPSAYSLILIAGIIALAMPTNIIGDELNWFPLKANILPIISFLFHGLMIFSSIFLLKSGLYNFKKEDYPRTIMVGLFFASIAMIVNQFLDKDFMLLNKGTGSPLNFLLKYSKPLYVSATIFGFFILIGGVFLITHLVMTLKRNKLINNH